MKHLAIGILFGLQSTQVLAHEGHGIDTSSIVHYVTGPHLLSSLGLAVGMAVVCYLVARHRRRQ